MFYSTIYLKFFTQLSLQDVARLDETGMCLVICLECFTQRSALNVLLNYPYKTLRASMKLVCVQNARLHDAYALSPKLNINAHVRTHMRSLLDSTDPFNFNNDDTLSPPPPPPPPKHLHRISRVQTVFCFLFFLDFTQN